MAGSPEHTFEAYEDGYLKAASIPLPVLVRDEDEFREPDCNGCGDPVTSCECRRIGYQQAMRDHEPPTVTEAWEAGLERGAEELIEWISGLRDEYRNSGHEIQISPKFIDEMRRWVPQIAEHVKQMEAEHAVE